MFRGDEDEGLVGCSVLAESLLLSLAFGHLFQFVGPKRHADYISKQNEETGVLLSLFDGEERHPEVGADFPLRVEADEFGSLEAGLGKFYKRFRECCGKEESLPSGGKAMDNLRQRCLKTHLEESISLIKNNVLDGLEVQIHLDDEVQQPTRCRDYAVEISEGGVAHHRENAHTSGLFDIISNCSSIPSPPTTNAHRRL